MVGNGLSGKLAWRVAPFLAVPASLLSLSGLSAQILTAPPRPALRMELEIPRCPDRATPDEIMVCGRRGDQERYRLPLRDERGSVYARGHPRGEVPKASAEANPSAPCGIFEGQRRCSKAEMRDYGYYGGRDVIAGATKVIESVVDSD